MSDANRRALVTVIIPTYNGSGFLRDAVGSVLAQEYPALELIVVNDGSTDDTDNVAARLPTAVRYLEQPRRTGPSEARNRGIRAANGSYLAFLDVDDLWPSGNLIRLMDHLLANPELDVVHGYAQLMLLDPESSRYQIIGSPRNSFPFYIGAGLYRRRVFEAVGLFDPELEFAEDTDWYLRAGELGRTIARLDAVTLHVRRHGYNMTRGRSALELNVLRVLKKSLDRKAARKHDCE